MTDISELDALEPRVNGRRLDGSIANFVRRCHAAIDAEQHKPLPDNAIISVLCDAVRFSREHLYLVEKYVLGSTSEASAAAEARDTASTDEMLHG